jgi:glucose-1-phosphate cytidylyltransferase
MQAVIFAGGYGTRISEETQEIPKPMIRIGGMPIIWHIMKIYSAHGVNEFIICCGYKGYVLKEFFKNYFIHTSDFEVSYLDNSIQMLQPHAEPWKIKVIDTGENVMTGGRLKRIGQYLNPDEAFCLTYGDGVADVNIQSLIAFHKSHKKKATLTAVKPKARFGALDCNGDTVVSFSEKHQSDVGEINGGFFVLDPSVIDLINGDDTVWEDYPLTKLAEQEELKAYRHNGFWQPMDTLRDKKYLENLWMQNTAPWKVW